jgi:hypothetical protein
MQLIGIIFAIQEISGADNPALDIHPHALLT